MGPRKLPECVCSEYTSANSLLHFVVLNVTDGVTRIGVYSDFVDTLLKRAALRTHKSATIGETAFQQCHLSFVKRQCFSFYLVFMRKIHFYIYTSLFTIMVANEKKHRKTDRTET